jgi:hypothetical protein
LSLEREDLIVNYPLHLLVTKVTIPHLRVIAACHGIYIHSKQHLVHIQNTILDHTCTVCSDYVCIFEPVNEEKILLQWRISNLHAVKNYQQKNLEIYSASHLLAVKKSCTKDPAKCKQNNLKAVQKKHSKDPEKWQQDNYVAVQKHRQNAKFPPCPPSLQLQQKIISDFCLETSPDSFVESGCTGCMWKIDSFTWPSETC